jgi:branched-chain amino acid transport system substrate-binding protein
MKIKPWLLALGLGAGLGMTSVGSMAQLPDRPVKVGVLTDMSGTYSAMGGAGSVAAAQLAIDDCLAAECKGMKIDLVSADNQNKADVAANKAREWFDRDNVDVIADLTNSAAALAVQKLAMDKQKVVLFSGPATTRLTNEDCSPTGFHWMFDTYSQSAATARAIVANGGKSWYFITVDYAFGHSLEKDAADNVKALGGTVVGQSRHPLNASDYASFLLQAQSSKAQVVALANGGQDTVNALKQAREFGIVQRGQKLAALLVFLSDVHALGLNTAQGLMFTDGFYWDYDDASRAWSARFQKKYKDLKPTMVQAGVYSSVLHYLRAVAATKSVDAKVVAQKMREMPIRDPIMHNASIRPDGRVIHDMYLFRVKSPAESKGPWDYYTKVGTVPATEAFQPLSKSSCALVKTSSASK